MSVEMIAGVTLDVNDEGFMTDPSQWNEAVALELARREGIEELSERHWQVIHFMRQEFHDKGTGPTVRILVRPAGYPSRSSTNCSPKAPRSSRRRSAASRSRAAVSSEKRGGAT